MTLIGALFSLAVLSVTALCLELRHRQAKTSEGGRLGFRPGRPLDADDLRLLREVAAAEIWESERHNEGTLTGNAHRDSSNL